MKTKVLKDVYGDAITVEPAAYCQEVRVRAYAPGASPTARPDEYEVYFYSPKEARRMAKALRRAAREVKA